MIVTTNIKDEVAAKLALCQNKSKTVTEALETYFTSFKPEFEPFLAEIQKLSAASGVKKSKILALARKKEGQVEEFLQLVGEGVVTEKMWIYGDSQMTFQPETKLLEIAAEIAGILTKEPTRRQVETFPEVAEAKKEEVVNG